MTASTQSDAPSVARAERIAELRADVEALYGKAVSLRYDDNTGTEQHLMGRPEACPGSEHVGFLLHEYDVATGTYAERGHWLPWARLRTAAALLLPGAVAVGDGVTRHLWSDRDAGTVTWVSASGKSFRWTSDKATALGPIHDREQYDYSYESTPVLTGTDFFTGKPTTNERTARWSQKSGRFKSGGNTVSAGRHQYRDPSF